MSALPLLRQRAASPQRPVNTRHGDVRRMVSHHE